jgi:hypothetical protein
MYDFGYIEAALTGGREFLLGSHGFSAADVMVGVSI